MARVPLAIVGCGGMGGRHLLGLKELEESGTSNIRLVAVCDLRRDNAQHLASEAETLLGVRPQVYDDLTDMATRMPDIQAVDITTDAGSHHVVARTAFAHGLHVLCEKPLALTVRGCNLILDAQRKAGRVLSVAENYRRDPMSRLTKALLEAGAVGQPTMFFDIGASAGDRIIILPWRHYKHMGGILVDGGVHNADLMLHYMGDVDSISSKAKLWEPVRRKGRDGGVSPFYERWQAEMPDTIEATMEDTLVSVLEFASGALGQWTQFYAAHGEGFGAKIVYCGRGSIRCGGIRNGAPPVVHVDGEGEMAEADLLSLVPDYHLDDITSRLFGDERPASYDLPFPAADRKLLAIEYHEFGQCILDGREPEVNGQVGRKALALCYGGLEAALLGCSVSLHDVVTEAVDTYQSEINEHWRI